MCDQSSARDALCVHQERNWQLMKALCGHLIETTQQAYLPLLLLLLLLLLHFILLLCCCSSCSIRRWSVCSTDR
jgi:hypothetical protein